MTRSGTRFFAECGLLDAGSGIKEDEKTEKAGKEAVPGGFPCFFVSGAYGIRTRDLLHAMETRSQLR